MLKVLAAVIAIIVIALVVVLMLASTKPDTFRVERSAVIKASPENIFPLIADFISGDGGRLMRPAIPR